MRSKSTSKLQTLTMKFGGTSVGDGRAISRVVEIVKAARASEEKHVVTIVSAMSQVTDWLERGLHSAASGDEAAYQATGHKLHEKHEAASRELLGDEGQPVMAEIEALISSYLRFCASVHTLHELSARALDYGMGL